MFCYGIKKASPTRFTVDELEQKGLTLAGSNIVVNGVELDEFDEERMNELEDTYGENWRKALQTMFELAFADEMTDEDIDWLIV